MAARAVQGGNMRTLIVVCLMWAGTALAQGQSGMKAGQPPAPGVVPGAEDGYFSAEDYRRLKKSREAESDEVRSLIRTRDGFIVIRRQDTPDGPRYQIIDNRPRRHDGTVIVVPQ